MADLNALAVEAAAKRLCALDLGNESFWGKIDESDREAYRSDANSVLSAALEAGGMVAVLPNDNELRNMIHNAAGCHRNSERTSKLVALIRSLAARPQGGKQ